MTCSRIGPATPHGFQSTVMVPFYGVAGGDYKGPKGQAYLARISARNAADAEARAKFARAQDPGRSLPTVEAIAYAERNGLQLSARYGRTGA